MLSLWFDNFVVYYDNLSMYYVVSVIMSFMALFLAWWYSYYSNGTELTSDQALMSENIQCEGAVSKSGLLKKIKLARQEAIEQELAAGLTDQQLQQEKETEQAQLAAIFKLLQEQEEKFQVSSMEELQEQLKLYRR
ncbi:uncharacterized protein LOC126475495 [Schistocerca serialis cubense]|uniref:uncharacterized protein LOC126475495 n=1 Tax=Schistocerca serialis cubense TaxID=2023355 RepID=UPI00214E6AB7|nr:uncharacterized protein LOC126475495 [Schistocerca serialis cubense]